MEPRIAKCLIRFELLGYNDNLYLWTSDRLMTADALWNGLIFGYAIIRVSGLHLRKSILN